MENGKLRKQLGNGYIKTNFQQLSIRLSDSPEMNTIVGYPVTEFPTMGIFQ